MIFCLKCQFWCILEIHTKLLPRKKCYGRKKGNDVCAFRQIAVSELHIGAISETPVIPTQHEMLCLPLRISKGFFSLNFAFVCMYAKREEYFLLEWIQWCQDIEYLENVFNIDACLLIQRMRKDVYQGSSQKGKIPEEVNLAPKMTIKVLLI